MSRELHLHVYDRQYDLLKTEASVSGLSMAELVRRALDFTYVPEDRPKAKGWQASVGWWSRPDAATVGRRAGTK